MLKHLPVASLMLFACFSLWADVASLLIGNPLGHDLHLVNHALGWTSGYDVKKKIPRWVQCELRKSNIQKDVMHGSPQQSWKPVPDLADSACDSDYKNSNYSRGHMVPKSMLKWDKRAYEGSFNFGNACPQHQDFNNGEWKALEQQVKKWALKYDRIFVITGPIVAEGDKTIGNGVDVPGAFYKVVYAPRIEQMIGFIIPTTARSEALPSFACSVREVEKRTEINFFTALATVEQERLESDYDLSMWGFKTGQKNGANEDGEVDTGYWLILNSNKRHNSSCKMYRVGNGRPCGPNDGKPAFCCEGMR